MPNMACKKWHEIDLSHNLTKSYISWEWIGPIYVSLALVYTGKQNQINPSILMSDATQNNHPYLRWGRSPIHHLIMTNTHPTAPGGPSTIKINRRSLVFELSFLSIIPLSLFFAYASAYSSHDVTPNTTTMRSIPTVHWLASQPTCFVPPRRSGVDFLWPVASTFCRVRDPSPRSASKTVRIDRLKW